MNFYILLSILIIGSLTNSLSHQDYDVDFLSTVNQKSCDEEKRIHLHETNSLKNDIVVLKNEIIKIKQAYDLKITTIQNQNSFLIRRNENLIKENTTENMANTKLSIEKTHYEKLQEQVKFLLNNNEELIKKNTSLNMKITQLSIEKKYIQNLEKNNQNYQKYIENLKMKMNNFENIQLENSNLKKEVSNYQSKFSLLNILEDKIKTFNHNNNELQNKLNSLLVENKNFHLTINSLKLEITSLNHKNVVLIENNHNYQTQIFTLEKNLNYVKNHNNCRQNNNKVVLIGSNGPEDQY